MKTSVRDGRSTCRCCIHRTNRTATTATVAAAAAAATAADGAVVLVLLLSLALNASHCICDMSHQATHTDTDTQGAALRS